MPRLDVYTEADLTQIATQSVLHRSSKVSLLDYAAPRNPAAPSLLHALPRQLGANDLRQVVNWWAATVGNRRGVLLMIGGHVIKVGIGPIICELLRIGAISHLALNGAAAIHDVELAEFQHTSEDVGQGLATGNFGTWEETGELFAQAAWKSRVGFGLGEALAQVASRKGLPALQHKRSVLAAAQVYEVPVTVHVMPGADIVHQHPLAKGDELGEATFRDFKRLAGFMGQLHDGGLALNWGSAVAMPEVFLKALNISRNLHEGLPHTFNTVNCDMIRHYRPEHNVLRRPTEQGGEYVHLTGQHEILLPLIGWNVLERLDGAPQ